MIPSKKIAVVGAGIAGVTAAYYLARKGMQVTVFESTHSAALVTSYANGGQLSVCNTPVWNTWSTVLKGIKWMFTPDAPLQIKPTWEWRKIQWLARFVATTQENVHDENTEKLVKLALQSRQAMLKICEDEGLLFDHMQRGILHVYTREQDFQAAKRLQSRMENWGCEWQIQDRDTVLRTESSLNPHMPIVGGIYTSDDSTGDIHKFTTALASCCEQKYGVKFRYNTKVTNISPNRLDVMVHDDLFDLVVIANGVAVHELSKQWGDDPGIYPVKGYSITVPLPDLKSQQHAPRVSLLDEHAKIVTSRLGEDRLRIAGTAELCGYDLSINSSRVQPLIDWCNRWYPNLDTSQAQPWAGLRPMTPHMLPCVGKSNRHARVWYHCGHGHLGWTLSAGTAQTLAHELAFFGAG